MVEYLHNIPSMVLQQFKNWMLPIAMITGGLFYPFFSQLAPVTPYLIFCMLLVPYCKISLTRIRIKPLHLFLILIQIIGGLGIYTALSFYDPLVAQGIFICILAPTATSAAVITGMLGGNVTSLATFSLLSNLCVAVLSPLIFSFIGEHVSMPFGHSFGIICRQMIPLLILPFVLAMLLRRFLPRVHHEIKKRQELSFYMWSVALATVTGNTVSFLMRQDASNYRIETIMALLALVVCGLQFITGRRIGRRFRDKVAGAQGLGQKNTILAIWMAQTYLNPVSSVAPAFYVVWQNIVNSYQLWLRRRDKG